MHNLQGAQDYELSDSPMPPLENQPNDDFNFSRQPERLVSQHSEYSQQNQANSQQNQANLEFSFGNNPSYFVPQNSRQLPQDDIGSQNFNIESPQIPQINSYNALEQRFSRNNSQNISISYDKNFQQILPNGQTLQSNHNDILPMNIAPQIRSDYLRSFENNSQGLSQNLNNISNQVIRGTPLHEQQNDFMSPMSVDFNNVQRLNDQSNSLFQHSNDENILEVSRSMENSRQNSQNQSQNYSQDQQNYRTPGFNPDGTLVSDRNIVHESVTFNQNSSANPFRRNIGDSHNQRWNEQNSINVRTPWNINPDNQS